ncbi:MAG: phage tail tube protein [Brevundimonas sp.]|uniref:phage tail tube protein n=1 Tax=Brevundimonas sp. TaxID=1871086 RepID=UPI00391DA5E6
MESQGITADGMSFSHRTSAPEITPKVWTELGEAVSITPPNPSRSSVDFTHLKSPNKTREHKPSMIEPGEANVTLNYTPETRAKIDALFIAEGIQEFQVGYPDGATETFSGFLTGKPTEGGEVEGKLTLNCPIKVTGLPVYVAGE